LSAAWSPDGKRIVTASADKTARVWTADGSGEPVVLKGHEAFVRSAAWSPDGERIVTASDDQTARVWPVSIPALQRVLRDATTDCLTPAMRRTYLDETETEARERYAACERSYGRVPFFPEDSRP
jgi:WD40 repeat protein